MSVVRKLLKRADLASFGAGGEALLAEEAEDFPSWNLHNISKDCAIELIVVLAGRVSMFQQSPVNNWW